MSLIIEQAGGQASTGMFKGKIQRVLELHPSDIHDKCPIIMGSPSMYVLPLFSYIYCFVKIGKAGEGGIVVEGYTYVYDRHGCGKCVTKQFF